MPPSNQNSPTRSFGSVRQQNKQSLFDYLFKRKTTELGAAIGKSPNHYSHRNSHRKDTDYTNRKGDINHSHRKDQLHHYGGQNTYNTITYTDQPSRHQRTNYDRITTDNRRNTIDHCTPVKYSQASGRLFTPTPVDKLEHSKEYIGRGQQQSHYRGDNSQGTKNQLTAAGSSQKGRVLSRNNMNKTIQEDHEYQEYPPKNQRSFLNQAKDAHNHTHRLVNGSVNAITSALYKAIEQGTVVAEKVHSLCVQLGPILTYFTEDSRQGDWAFAAKMAKQVRIKIPSIEKSISEFKGKDSLQQAEGLLTEFQISLADHIKQIVANQNQLNKKQREKQVYQNSTQLKEQIKQFQIQSLKLKKQNALFEAKLIKAQDQIIIWQTKAAENEHKSIQKLSDRQQQRKQQAANMKADFERSAERLMDEIKRLKEELLMAREAGIVSPPIRSDLIAEREFLLQQLQNQKVNFSADMARLHELYSEKEKSLNFDIQRLKDELQLAHSVSEATKTPLNPYNESVRPPGNQIPTALLKRDLMMLNQQLYRHWLAMGRIEQLMRRQGQYDKIKPIFDELHYDHHMF